MTFRTYLYPDTRKILGAGHVTRLAGSLCTLLITKQYPRKEKATRLTSQAGVRAWRGGG